MVEQLTGVAVREPSVATDLDLGRRRQRVRGQLFDDENVRCVIPEMRLDGRSELGRHLVAGQIALGRSHHVDQGELVDGGVDGTGQLERCRRIEAKRPRRHAVHLTAVGVERRRAHRRQHQCRRLERGRLGLEPVVDDPARPDEPSRFRDPVEDRLGVAWCVGRLGHHGAVAAEEGLADLRRPGQSRQHPHGLGDLVEDGGDVAVSVEIRLSELLHRQSIPHPTRRRSSSPASLDVAVQRWEGGCLRAGPGLVVATATNAR